MDWIELIVHTTTEGSDAVSGLLKSGIDAGAVAGPADGSEKDNQDHTEPQTENQHQVAGSAGPDSQHAFIDNPAHQAGLKQIHRDLAGHQKHAAQR